MKLNYVVGSKDSFNAFSSNKNLTTDSTNQNRFELPNDKKILQEIRDYNNLLIKDMDYSQWNGNRVHFVTYTESSRTFLQEAEAREWQTSMPTQAEYEKAKEFLARQMDKVMLEIARENYDLIPLAAKFTKMREDLTQAEQDLIGERDLTEFIYIMQAYFEKDCARGSREIKEWNGQYDFTSKQAQSIALLTSYESLIQEKDGALFFGVAAKYLSQEQREEMLNAIAKVRVYEKENGFQYNNAFFKYNAATGRADVWLIDKQTNFQTESLILRYSNLASQSVLEMLDSKDTESQSSIMSSSDSLMQTLLKESKENKNHQGQ